MIALGIALGIGGLLILLVLGLCRTAADPIPPVVMAALTPDDPSLPKPVYAGDDLLAALYCSDEEICRRLKKLTDVYDAPDTRLYESLYLLPEENR